VNPWVGAASPPAAQIRAICTLAERTGRVLEAVGVQRDEAIGAQVGGQRPEWLRPVPITSAPAQRASWTAVDPTAPPAPWMTTVCPLASFPWSNRACHAVRPARGTAATWTSSAVCGFGATLRLRRRRTRRPPCHGAGRSARTPGRRRRFRPSPDLSAATTPDTSWPGMIEVR